MLKQIQTVLWRKCKQATLDSLRGLSPGQYDIRLTSKDYSGFFDGVARIDTTPLDGFTVVVPIEPYDGLNPVSATELKIRFMGTKSERRDWNIPSQRPDSAYELWRPGRGPAASGAPGSNEYLVIARDVEGKFHARWISDEIFETLPLRLKQLLQSSDAGWETV